MHRPVAMCSSAKGSSTARLVHMGVSISRKKSLIVSELLARAAKKSSDVILGRVILVGFTEGARAARRAVRRVRVLLVEPQSDGAVLFRDMVSHVDVCGLVARWCPAKMNLVCYVHLLNNF